MPAHNPDCSGRTIPLIATQSLDAFTPLIDMNLPSKLFKPALVAAACVMVLTACGDTQKPAPGASSKSVAAAPAGSGSSADDALRVSVKPEMLERFKSVPVSEHELASVQEVSGRIEANEQKVTRVGAAAFLAVASRHDNDLGEVEQEPEFDCFEQVGVESLTAVVDSDFRVALPEVLDDLLGVTE